MIVIRETATQEIQFVTSLDGYGGGYEVLGELPEGANPEEWAVDSSGAIVRNVERAQSVKRAEIDAKLNAVFMGGFTVPTGPLAGHVLQLRGPEDRTNWLASAHAYKTAIDAGFGSVADAHFRTAANITVTVTYAEGHQALLDLQKWGADIMAVSWQLKDAVDQAMTIEEVEAVNVEAAGWPS